MRGLAHRLEQVKLDIGDQADYLQQLLDQFDIPYDAFCSLQSAVDELQTLSQRIAASALAITGNNAGSGLNEG